MGRTIRRLIVVCVGSLAIAGVIPCAAVSVGAPKVVVSLTFDDGLQTQILSLPVLEQHGMRATF